MTLNHEYIKQMLLGLESVEVARPYLSELLKKLGLEDFSEEFLLHYEALLDYRFIEVLNDTSMGVAQGADGDITWSDVPIRLTATGHEFIAAMNKPEVWDVIKKDFKESSVKTIF